MQVATGVLAQRAAAGDMRSLVALQAVPHEQVLDEVGTAQLLVLRESVASVLSRLGRAEIEPEQARQWASFVRWGFAGHEHRGPLTPLSIEYEQAYEVQIADVVARLDEIGDVIDGEVPDGPEIAAFLESLDLTM
jgi:hypothetical protein